MRDLAKLWSCCRNALLANATSDPKMATFHQSTPCLKAALAKVSMVTAYIPPKKKQEKPTNPNALDTKACQRLLSTTVA